MRSPKHGRWAWMLQTERAENVYHSHYYDAAFFCYLRKLCYDFCMQWSGSVEFSKTQGKPHVIWFHDGEGALPLPFRSAAALERFLTYLPTGQTCLITLSDQDRSKLTDLVSREERFPQAAAADPARTAFLRRVTAVAWNSMPPEEKRRHLLVLFRPLVNPGVLQALARFSPDIFIARVQAETVQHDSVPGQAA